MGNFSCTGHDIAHTALPVVAAPWSRKTGVVKCKKQKCNFQFWAALLLRTPSEFGHRWPSGRRRGRGVPAASFTHSAAVLTELSRFAFSSFRKVSQFFIVRSRGSLARAVDSHMGIRAILADIRAMFAISEADT